MATETDKTAAAQVAQAAILTQIAAMELELARLKRAAQRLATQGEGKSMRDFRGYWKGRVDVGDDVLEEVIREVNRGDKHIG